MNANLLRSAVLVLVGVNASLAVSAIIQTGRAHLQKEIAGVALAQTGRAMAQTDRVLNSLKVCSAGLRDSEDTTERALAMIRSLRSEVTKARSTTNGPRTPADSAGVLNGIQHLRAVRKSPERW